ncbi:hypothetical protein QA641_15835 [Bradyrhizobium sp. CB1650]|uniref:hypothetical protein n=1 Tax=Bradyrhizobium sp. CB1650 TaxID=3039153 RepID=UPI002434DEEB|nr:hypothetical protein [Bradyrhizobium sp. CB1650]WGD55215.1 hypothetical protein QA641_15835 [Bradyrhizobium sp. CB1650]
MAAENQQAGRTFPLTENPIHDDEVTESPKRTLPEAMIHFAHASQYEVSRMEPTRDAR